MTQSFKQWELAQLARQEVITTNSPGVESSSPVRDKFFAEFIFL